MLPGHGQSQSEAIDHSLHLTAAEHVRAPIAHGGLPGTPAPPLTPPADINPVWLWETVEKVSRRGGIITGNMLLPNVIRDLQRPSDGKNSQKKSSRDLN